MARKPPPKMNCKKDANGRFIKGTCVPAGGTKPVVAKPRAPRARREREDFGGQIQMLEGVGAGTRMSSSSIGGTLLMVLGFGAVVLGGIAAYRQFKAKQLEAAAAAKNPPKAATDPATLVGQGIEIATNLTKGGTTPSAAMSMADAVVASIGGKVIPIRPLGT